MPPTDQDHRGRARRSPARGRSSPPSPATARSKASACRHHRRRGFWALVYQPRGINPATGQPMGRRNAVRDCRRS